MFTTSRLLVYGGLVISLCLTVTQAATDVSCMNKYKINDYGIRSGHRLSLICNGSSVNIIITQEQSRMDDDIALDYYCYHLNGSALKNGNLFRTLGPGNHNYNRDIVPTNSRCVFVGCVDKYGISNQWYYMKGNGSSCTNQVPETSSSIPTSSTVLVPTISSLSSSISEDITSSIFMPTPITSSLDTPLPTASFIDISSSSILYSSTLTTSYVANSLHIKSMNSSSENTQKLTTSTSSAPITSEATSEITASSSTTNTPIISSTAASESTSDIMDSSTAITPSSPTDASQATGEMGTNTPSPSSIISNTVAVIFGVLVLVIVTLIISCLIVIVCTRKAISTTNKNVIVEIPDSKIFESMLPSEHLKDSHSLCTICADLNFKETPNIDYKKNTTNTQETSCGSHTTTTIPTTTTTTTITTDKLPHTDESIVSSIEYSEGSGELEGSCPALYDTSITTVTAQAYTYSSDYVVEESITVHSLMNSSYITVAEMTFS